MMDINEIIKPENKVYGTISSITAPAAHTA